MKQSIRFRGHHTLKINWQSLGKRFLVAAFFCILSGFHAEAQVKKFVKTNGSDSNTGNSWDVSYATIAKALADGATEVYVASGNYTVSSVITLPGRNILIQGGFNASTHTTGTQRTYDPVAAPTVLTSSVASGFITGTATANTKVELKGLRLTSTAIESSRTRGIYLPSTTGQTYKLTQVEVYGISMTGSSNQFANTGAVNFSGPGKLAIEQSIFRNNTNSVAGPALQVPSAYGTVDIANTQFTQNTNTSGANGVGGGAVNIGSGRSGAASGTGTVNMYNTWFNSNAAPNVTSQGIPGGGLRIKDAATVTMEVVHFYCNTITNTNSTIANNINGGAMGIGGTIRANIRYCLFTRNNAYQANELFRNDAATYDIVGSYMDVAQTLYTPAGSPGYVLSTDPNMSNAMEQACRTPLGYVYNEAGVLGFAINGTVNVNPQPYDNATLNAVLTDANGNIVDITKVDLATGAFSFKAINGESRVSVQSPTRQYDYKVYLVNGDPAVTSVITAPAVSAGWTQSPNPTNVAMINANATPQIDLRKLPDTDGDGIPDIDDKDDDNDGIIDTSEGDFGSGTPRDTDGDGIPDSRDLDSDNDGINDVIEARIANLDSDGDGMVDGPVSMVAATLGVPIAALASNGNPIPPINRDGDGVPDMTDLDSDNDGINDIIESGNTAAINADVNNNGILDPSESPDPDGDGIRSVVDGKPTVWGDAPISGQILADTDSDTVPDFRDLDSDNDGINDLVESGLTGYTDANGNGMIDMVAGSDPDNDGIVAVADGAPSVRGDAPTTNSPARPKDRDGDGVPDYRDLDSDNDGINDVRESGLPASADADGNGTVDPTTPDTDADGIIGVADGNPNQYGDAPTTISPAEPKDTDGDGVPDYNDLDSDNDSIYDFTENGGIPADDTNNDGRIDFTSAAASDPDGDGILNPADGTDNVWGDAGDSVRDTDGDGVTNANDLDSDNDGINDVIEAGGSDPDGNALAGTGVPTVNVDGIPAGGGITPPDSDSDGAGDPYDLDSDNDGLSDLRESGDATAIAGDLDNDGTIDVVNGGDPDGDGIQNPSDATANTWGDSASPTPKDTDGDGTPDYKDLDSDGDGTLDIETTPYSGTDANHDGRIDDDTDADHDGIADIVDEKDNVFGGLPYHQPVPDLTPIVTMTNPGFIKPNALTRPAVLKVYNVGGLGSVTSGPVNVYIYPPGTGSTVALTNSPDWTISYDAVGNFYTLTTTVTIQQGLAGVRTVNLELSVAPATPNGKSNFTFEIADNAGGEANNTNNTTSQEVVISSH